jgi:hypothetical protein
MPCESGAPSFVECQINTLPHFLVPLVVAWIMMLVHEQSSHNKT